MSLQWEFKPRMSKSQANQLDRIRMDETIEEQEDTLKNDMKVAMRARWTETLEESSENKRLKEKIKESKQEMKLANKALTEVRRTQLKEILQSEQKQLEQELHSMGLTFYKERL